MKFLINFLLTAALTYALGLYFPWWSLTIASFFVALIAGHKLGISMLAGFLSVLLLWGIMSFAISVGNDHILAHRMSMVILKKDNPIMLVLMTALIGGVLGGVSAWSGAALRGLLKPKD